MSLRSDNTIEQEFALHAQTRAENDTRLLPQVDALRTGQAVEALEPFAKAYLGLFLDIDSTFPPVERLRFLLSENIAQAVLEGFSCVLRQHSLPKPEEIGNKMAQGERFEIGYIVLAGMDYLAQQSKQSLYDLPTETINSAICFHYANNSSFSDAWVEPLLKDKSDALAPVLESFWMGIIRQGTDYIPGLHDYLDDKVTNKQHLSQILLPILGNWSGYKKKFLAELLQNAIRYTDTESLCAVVAQILQRNDPDLIPAKRILWLATAFILQPDRYWQELLDYTQRSKEKILPLLDFCVELVTDVRYEPYVLPHQTLAKLLRIIAPKFPPHYDNFDNLTENAKKTLRLFHVYANLGEDISESINWLQSVRVMNIVRDLVVVVNELNQDYLNDKHAVHYGYEDFVMLLRRAGKLQSRKGKFEYR